MLLIRLLAAAALLVAIALGLGLFQGLRVRTQLQADLASQAAVASARFAALKLQFQWPVPPIAPPTDEPGPKRDQTAPSTSATFDARLKAAGDWAAAGRLSEALDEYLRLHRESAGNNRLRVVNRIAALVAPPLTFAAATETLRSLREAATQTMADKPQDLIALQEIARLNQALGEEGLTAELYDALPPDVRNERFGPLGPFLLPAFVQARRYTDALRERPFSSMLVILDAGTAGGSPSQMSRSNVIEETLTGIEILTGAGRTDEAKILTNRLLDYVPTEETHELVRQRIERAKQP